MKKLVKVFFLFLVLTIGAVSFNACNNNIKPINGDIIEITDLLNRTVEVPTEINKVVCIGAGALRLYSYVGDMTKLSGVEDVDKDGTGVGSTLSIRPYKMVNAQLFNALPSCGMGGPTGSADAEKILACNPDVIFSMYTSDKVAMDKLQNQTGIPVVTLSYGTVEAFDENVKASIKLIGRIMNRDSRADEIVDYINGIVTELSELSLEVNEKDKPSVYIGCQSKYGTHGIESSTGDYSIFDVSGIKNVLDINGYSGYQKNVELEALLTMNPNIIIIDAGGLSIMKTQYADSTKAEIFNSMDAFKNGEVYLQMPYNAYYTNLEIAYCDAYFDAYVAYPTHMKGFDYVAKSREIITKFLGKDCYDDIAYQMFGGFQKLDLEQTFENYSK